MPWIWTIGSCPPSLIQPTVMWQLPKAPMPQLISPACCRLCQARLHRHRAQPSLLASGKQLHLQDFCLVCRHLQHLQQGEHVDKSRSTDHTFPRASISGILCQSREQHVTWLLMQWCTKPGTTHTASGTFGASRMSSAQHCLTMSSRTRLCRPTLLSSKSPSSQMSIRAQTRMLW